MVHTGYMAHVAHVDWVVAGMLAASVLAFGGLRKLSELSWRRLPVRLAIGGVAFQVFHVAEHLLQVGYWMMHPSQAPWLTPWAAAGRDILATGVGGEAAGGAELLHLLGNGIFMAGLLALAVLVRRQPAKSKVAQPNWALRGALWSQGFHTVEHVLLTTTWLTGGTALGFTNLFGAVPGGAAGATTRVWVHFAINLVATMYGVIALRHAGVWPSWQRSTSTATRDVAPLPRLGAVPRN